MALCTAKIRQIVSAPKTEYYRLKHRAKPYYSKTQRDTIYLPLVNVVCTSPNYLTQMPPQGLNWRVSRLGMKRLTAIPKLKLMGLRLASAKVKKGRWYTRPLRPKSLMVFILFPGWAPSAATTSLLIDIQARFSIIFCRQANVSNPFTILLALTFRENVDYGCHSRKARRRGKYSPTLIGRLSTLDMARAYRSNCPRYRCTSESRNASMAPPSWVLVL